MPGAQAPGSNNNTSPEPAIAGDSAKFSWLSPAAAGSILLLAHLTWGLRPRLYAYACYRRLRTYACCRRLRTYACCRRLNIGYPIQVRLR